MVIIRQSGNIKKNSFENDAWQQQSIIVGLDEVGRGCFAGPVVAAAVVLPLNKAHRMLKDSKIMTVEERNKAFEWIKKNCHYGVGIVHHRTIDERNIYQATLTAMKKALMHAMQSLPARPAVIITDAMPLNLSDTHFHDIPVYHFPKGESKSSSIAAASIVAKVTRDAMMALYDQAVPGYKFADNKGYGTAVHRDVLQQNVHSLIHRRSFVNTFLKKYDEQLTMFEVSHDETGEVLCGSD